MSEYFLCGYPVLLSVMIIESIYLSFTNLLHSFPYYCLLDITSPYKLFLVVHTRSSVQASSMFLGIKVLSTGATSFPAVESKKAPETKEIEEKPTVEEVEAVDEPEPKKNPKSKKFLKSAKKAAVKAGKTTKKAAVKAGKTTKKAVVKGKDAQSITPSQ
ncbi:Uridylate kinase [Trichinella pseudospiralis]